MKQLRKAKKGLQKAMRQLRKAKKEPQDDAQESLNRDIRNGAAAEKFTRRKVFYT